MTKQKLWTKDFISISLCNFFVFSTFYFLLVTLPTFSIQEFNSSTSEAGLMSTVFLISAIISRPFAGKWIEQSGYRKVIMMSLVIFLFSTLLYFFPKSMSTFLIIRFLHGVGFGMVTTAAGAIVANIIPVSRRGEGMGYFIMSTNLSMVLGPFLGLSIMQQFGANALFALSSVFSLGAFITGLSIKLPKIEQPAIQTKDFSVKSFIETSAVPISIVGAFFAILYSSILSFVSVYAKEVHLAGVSSLFFIVYAVLLIASRPFTGRWFDRYGANKIIFPSILLFALGILLLSRTQGAGSFLSSAGLIGLGWGTIFPLLQTIAIQDAVQTRKAVATATFLSIYDTGMGLGSFIVGVLAANIGFRSLYFIGTFYVLLGMGLYYFLHARKQVMLKKQLNQTHQPNLAKSDVTA